VAYRIGITRKAQRELGKFPRKEQERIKAAIDSLAQDPRPCGTVEMEDLVSVFRVRHRKDAYRGV
jgi:mRNA-degrading endonuclease RelE of RelBE toxin-antitoxin system